jgi:hypothetical protein
MWLIALVILSALFALALSSREREIALQAREDLIDARTEFNNALMEMQIEYNRDIADLNIENAMLRGEKRL